MSRASRDRTKNKTGAASNGRAGFFYLFRAAGHGLLRVLAPKTS
jgi:hypothetical protein